MWVKLWTGCWRPPNSCRVKYVERNRAHSMRRGDIETNHIAVACSALSSSAIDLAKQHTRWNTYKDHIYNKMHIWLLYARHIEKHETPSFSQALGVRSAHGNYKLMYMYRCTYIKLGTIIICRLCQCSTFSASFHYTAYTYLCKANPKLWGCYADIRRAVIAEP